MQYRRIGDQDASIVAFGAWAIGGWMWGGADEDDAVDAVHAALDVGMNFIDTAPIYGFGVSEERIGRALQGKRDQAFIATKCGMVWGPEYADKGEFKFHSDDQRINPEGRTEVRIYLDPASIRRELEVSLERLKTDHVDLYQTHWQEATTPIEDTMAELERMRDEGKIRAIGVCNASPGQMDAYRAVGRLDADQEKYAMLDRELEASNLPYCREHGIAFLAYSPLARGLLTGKVTPDRRFDEGDQRAHMERFSVENRKRVQSMLDQIQPIADEHGITLTQLTIAWTAAQPGCTHVLCGRHRRIRRRRRLTPARRLSHPAPGPSRAAGRPHAPRPGIGLLPHARLAPRWAMEQDSGFV